MDKSRFYSVSEIRSDQTFVLVKGVLFDLRTVGEGRTKRLVGELKDATGSLDLVWFKPPQFLLKTLKNGQVYQVFEKPRVSVIDIQLPILKFQNYLTHQRLRV